MPDSPYDAKDIDEYIMAQHYALRIVVTALLDTHPDPAPALAHLDTISEHMRANLLNRSLPDSFHEEFENTLASLRKRLQRP